MKNIRMQYSYEGFLYTFSGKNFMFCNKTYKKEDYNTFAKIYKFLPVKNLSEDLNKFEVNYWKALGKTVLIHQTLRKRGYFW